jgi:hypothetical protein
LGLPGRRRRRHRRWWRRPGRRMAVRARTALLRSFSSRGEVDLVGRMGFAAPSDLAGARACGGRAADHGTGRGGWRRSRPDLGWMGCGCYARLRPWPFTGWTACHAWRVLRGCCASLRLADVVVRVVLDLPDFSGGFCDQARRVAWVLNLNKAVVLGFLSRQDKDLLDACLLDLAGVASSERLRRRTPLGTITF